MYGFKLHTIGGVKSRHVGLTWDPIMEGDARYHWAAIGEVNSAAAAIIAAECAPLNIISINKLLYYYSLGCMLTPLDDG